MNGRRKLILSLLSLLSAFVLFAVAACDGASTENSSATPSEDSLTPSSEDISYPDESEIEDPESLALSSTEETSSEASSETSSAKSSAVKKPYSFAPKYAVVYEPAVDYFHYEKGADKKVKPASTAKLMTAIVALSLLSPEETLTVGDELDLVAKDASRVGLSKGDAMTVRELIYGLMVASGGDAAYTLAAAAGKKLLPGETSPKKLIDAFMKAVNEAADLNELTAVCNFVTPDGNDAENGLVTARAMAIIAAEAIKNEVIKEATSAKSHTFRYTSTGKEKTYYNTNKLLRNTSEYYSSYADGIKTGTTSEAGNCLVAGVRFGERYFIIVDLGAKSDEYRYKDVLELIKMCKTFPEIELPPESSDPEASSDVSDVSDPESSVVSDPEASSDVSDVSEPEISSDVSDVSDPETSSNVSDVSEPEISSDVSDVSEPETPSDVSDPASSESESSEPESSESESSEPEPSSDVSEPETSSDGSNENTTSVPPEYGNE